MVVRKIRYRLGGFHRDYRSIIPDTFAALAETYKRAALTEVNGYRKEGDRSLGFTDNGNISLNLHWFSRPIGELQKSALEGMKHGIMGVPRWHDGMKEPAHLFTHEFGHTLEYGLRNRREFRDFVETKFGETRREPSCAVSGYALVNDSEWLAETFAASQLAGPLTTGMRQAKELAEFLEGI